MAMAEAGLAYSPDSPYREQSGFLNALSENQTAALHELQTHMINASVNLADVAFNYLHPSLVLLRYLRANAFDVARAAEHITRNIEWRREHSVGKLCTMQPEEILKCDMPRFAALFPHWHCGYDRQRRPVLYKQYGGFECTELLKMTTIEAVAQYHIWEQEACMRLCMLQSLRSGYLVETLTAVIDVAGMQLRQVDSSFMAIVKAIANIDQAQYPETLGRFYIINTPYIFPMVWKMVKTFLDPVVASKIHIISKRSDWEPALLDYIGAENLSATYGGTAPPLSPELHPYTEIMATWPKQDSLTSQGVDRAPFSLASPVMLMSGNDGLLNTFSPSLSSPSASTIDSDSSSGSSAFGDTVEGLDDTAWDGARAAGAPGGSVLGILKSHEGWNYELAFLKASRENRILTEKGKSRSVAFSATVILGAPQDEGNAARVLPSHPKPILVTPKTDHALVSSPGSFSYQPSADEDSVQKSQRHRWNGICSLGLALLWYLKDSAACTCRCERFFAFLLAPLQSRSMTWLLKAFKVSILAFTMLSICSMVASAYALESIRNISSLKLEMWTGLVGMLLSSLTFLINLTGFFAYYLRNRRLMIMYCVCLSAIILAFIAIAIVSSMFLSSSPVIQGIGDKALGGVRGNVEAKALLKRYNIIFCVGSWVVAFWAFIPMIFAAALSNKMEALEGRDSEDEEREDDFYEDQPTLVAQSSTTSSWSVAFDSGGLEEGNHVDTDANFENGFPGERRLGRSGEWLQWTNGRSIKRKRSISSLLLLKLNHLSRALVERRQLGVVVHVSLLVCLIFSLAMIGYGAYAINYLLEVRFDYPMFAAYALLYCGITLLLVVAYGVWASLMDSSRIIWVQKTIFVPAICVAVTASAALSLGLLADLRKNVRVARDAGILRNTNENKLQDNTEIQLLVEGIIGFAVCFFQLVCYVSFKELGELAQRIEELCGHVNELILIVGRGKGQSETTGIASSSEAADVFRPQQHSYSGSSLNLSGPRRHSPWANAEWMHDINRIAQQSVGPVHVSYDMGGADSASGILSLDHNVLATDAFGGNGSFRSMYLSHPLYTRGLKRVLAMAYYRRWLYLQSVPHLTVMEKILMTWGILVGLAFIYIKGTFVIFSSWVGNDSTPSWIISLWRVMALTDRRYSSSDDFLVSTEGFLALVIGPMALMFAWSILARSPFRHPIGIFCSTADLYTLLLSIAIEIRTKFRNVSLDNLTIFVLLFVVVNIIRGLTSLFVLIMESWQIASKTDRLAKAQSLRLGRRRWAAADF